MDPYFEKYQYCADITLNLLVAIRNSINRLLLPRYEALIEEYVVVTHDDIRLHRVKPDVTDSASPQWTPEAVAATALAEPTIVELDYPDLDPITQRVLKVIQRSNRQVVTVIKLDLQTVFQAAYEPACYDRMLPYDESVEPSLSREDEAWARERLKIVTGAKSN